MTIRFGIALMICGAALIFLACTGVSAYPVINSVPRGGDVFIGEQDLFRRFVRGSRLPFLEVDVSDNDIPRAVEQIADWLESTGGLYLHVSFDEPQVNIARTRCPQRKRNQDDR